MLKLYLSLFACSGFGTVIHLSVALSYLENILGRAHAQHMLLITSLLGGIAVGAWGAGKACRSMTNLFKAFAITEFLLGISGIYFHTGMVTVMHPPTPMIPPDTLWLLPLIGLLPYALLVGASGTFISAALLRSAGENEKRGMLAHLFCLYSIVIALGLMMSEFYFTPHMGLPGNVLTAGLLKTLLALVAWISSQQSAQVVWGPPPLKCYVKNKKSTWSGLVLIACLTLSTLLLFSYQTSSTRLLSTFLGPSTQTITLIHTAFFCMLGLGSLWMRYTLPPFQPPSPV